MNKKYRHKPTGRIAEFCNEIRDGVRYFVVLREYVYIPEWAIGSDWEEINEDPIITYFGVDMYLGDKYWYVDKDDFKIYESKIFGSMTDRVRVDTSFPAKELADAYVRNNKPVYPAGIVEKLISEIEWCMKNEAVYMRVAGPLDDLKKFIK